MSISQCNLHILFVLIMLHLNRSSIGCLNLDRCRVNRALSIFYLYAHTFSSLCLPEAAVVVSNVVVRVLDAWCAKATVCCCNLRQRVDIAKHAYWISTFAENVRAIWIEYILTLYCLFYHQFWIWDHMLNAGSRISIKLTILFRVYKNPIWVELKLLISTPMTSVVSGIALVPIIY